LKDKITYLNLSDIHLGHEQNKTNTIIENLKKYFDVNEELFSKLDMIVITGDIFDKLLPSNSQEYMLANMWLTDLVLFCVRYNIILRVLEGTPGHDWKQAKLINGIISKLNLSIDFKYIDTLYIEENSKLGISMLFIPDEYKSTAKETLEDVKALLKEKKLDKVDLTFIHGQFNYQLPMVKLKSSHTEEEYLKLTKYYISIGHIHKRSNLDRILAPGSFDRLAHNEEEPKGGYYITIYKNDMEYFFIENKNAKPFLTFTYDEVDVERIKKDILHKVKKIPEGSHIRILIKDNDTVIKSLKAFRSEFPFLNIKIEVKKDKKRINILPEETSNVLQDTVQITKDNIKDLLSVRMEKYNLSGVENMIYEEEMSELI